MEMDKCNMECPICKDSTSDYLRLSSAVIIYCKNCGKVWENWDGEVRTMKKGMFANK